MTEIITINKRPNSGIKRFLWIVLMSFVGYFVFIIIPFAFYFIFGGIKLKSGIAWLIVVGWEILAIYSWWKLAKRNHWHGRSIKILLRNNDKSVSKDKMKLRQIFNAVDPVGIYFGDNDDEYDPEINSLQNSFINFSNESELCNKLLEIFPRFFEGVDFNKNRVKKLAKIISKEQRRFDRLKKSIVNRVKYEQVSKWLKEKFPEYRKNAYFDENENDPYIILGGISSLAFEDIDQKKDRRTAESLVELADEIINDEKSDPKVTNLFVVEVLEHLTDSQTGALLASGILHGESLKMFEQVKKNFGVKVNRPN